MSIINIGLRYAAAFGTLAVASESRTVPSESDYNFDLREEQKSDFENVMFKYQDEEIKFGDMGFVPTSAELSSILAPPPLVFFSQSKHHVESPINGGDGMVVEEWGVNPWDIRIRGLLIDTENRTYPENKVEIIRRLFQYSGIVKAIGTQFLDKDVENLYFKSISFNGVPGFEDTIQYTLVARSIQAVGFTLLNPNL